MEKTTTDIVPNLSPAEIEEYMALLRELPIAEQLTAEDWQEIKHELARSEVAKGLSRESKQWLVESEANDVIEERLIREGKLKPPKPWSKHLLDKMDSSGPFAEDIYDAPPPAAAKPADAAE